MMEFHISRKARDRYRFAETLFSYNGNVVFASVAACRAFAHQMNLVRESDKHPELAVHAGQLFAMGLIDEASHVLMARYREQFDPEVMTSALGLVCRPRGNARTRQHAADICGAFSRPERDARRGNSAAMAEGQDRQNNASRSGA